MPLICVSPRCDRARYRSHYCDDRHTQAISPTNPFRRWSTGSRNGYITAWQCIGGDKIEAPQPCIGVCRHRASGFARRTQTNARSGSATPVASRRHARRGRAWRIRRHDPGIEKIISRASGNCVGHAWRHQARCRKSASAWTASNPIQRLNERWGSTNDHSPECRVMLRPTVADRFHGQKARSNRTKFRRSVRRDRRAG